MKVHGGGESCKSSRNLTSFLISQEKKFLHLKVPKGEIFDLFDFNDFYVMSFLGAEKKKN